VEDVLLDADNCPVNQWQEAYCAPAKWVGYCHIRALNEAMHRSCHDTELNKRDLTLRKYWRVSFTVIGVSVNMDGLCCAY